MAFKMGDRVHISPLDREGRVIAAQNAPRTTTPVRGYLVRYEVGLGTAERRSLTGVYFEDELASSSPGPS